MGHVGCVFARRFALLCAPALVRRSARCHGQVLRRFAERDQSARESVLDRVCAVHIRRGVAARSRRRARALRQRGHGADVRWDGAPLGVLAAVAALGCVPWPGAVRVRPAVHCLGHDDIGDAVVRAVGARPGDDRSVVPQRHGLGDLVWSQPLGRA
eukprot:Amastigsp_a682391_7.p3 type:complete len:156 gc:universal Amastigsp_a682391_7:130-597(+)